MNNIYYQCMKETIDRHEEIGMEDILIYYKVSDRRCNCGYRVQRKICKSVKDACETILKNKKIVCRWFTCCHNGIAEPLLAVHFD